MSDTETDLEVSKLQSESEFDPELSKLENESEYDPEQSKIKSKSGYDPESSKIESESEYDPELSKYESESEFDEDQSVTSRPGTKHLHACHYEDCDMKFSRPSRLLVHINSHTGEKPFKCSFSGCNKAYARKTHLQRHLKRSHEAQPQKLSPSSSYQCPNCHNFYSSKYSLNKHMRKYTKKYECKTCGKVFHKNHMLRAHETEHSGKNRWPCEHCDESFQYPSMLKRHVKRNHVQKIYECNQCEMTFDMWTALNKHIFKEHKSQTAPVACETCGKKYKNKGLLKIHRKCHEETREVFHCYFDDCPRYYYFERNLRQHVSSYHEGKKIECTFEGCSEKFSFKFSRDKHIQVVHQGVDVRKKKEVKPKKARKDKGSVKKPIAAVLTQMDVPMEEAKTMIGEDNFREFDAGEINEEIQKNPVLREEFKEPFREIEFETAHLCERPLSLKKRKVEENPDDITKDLLLSDLPPVFKMRILPEIRSKNVPSDSESDFEEVMTTTAPQATKENKVVVKEPEVKKKFNFANYLVRQ